jgi:hypothetical protein
MSPTHALVKELDPAFTLGICEHAYQFHTRHRAATPEFRRSGAELTGFGSATVLLLCICIVMDNP